ncbi:AraC family transcriptional regulator [Salipaludibacillus agaradhaerens]|uniref:AraC family transcriptional regulator n=1 Tax=Salipaludibacillus agaradhaerens TaxID=76935 RepID=A0A9Q4B2E9_SALAG|nr:AraC family transcriptional regulator [Salipaludibacillus agaradhaerens]MCR6097094.1 AraC family transcriptional regulator [Salipaludibacillus agaradhaerens]MCR6113421.1 AraC family transcriptional regulator [Salipaludibacillus agaradhaerens]
MTNQPTVLNPKELGLIECIHASHHLLSQDMKSYKLVNYTFLFFKKGDGDLYINEKRHFIKMNRFFLLHPGMTMRIANKGENLIHYYHIEFRKVHVHDSTFNHLQGPIYAAHPSALAHHTENLVHKPKMEGNQQLKKLRLQMLTYELIYFLHTDQHTISQSNIKIAEEFIQTHYQEDINRDMLASMTGLSPSHFSVRFKKETGRSPMDYLTHIRIEKAKELLTTTNDRLKGIAKSVGYQDEFYFSRIFKKVSGIPPTVYSQTKRHRIVNLVCAFNGHFHALNHIPFASLNNNAVEGYRLYTHKNPIYFSKGRGIYEIFHSLLDKLADMNPDLIICGDFPAEFEESTKHVAPTINIPWAKQDWRGHLQQIAQLIGKEEEAAKWLNEYDEKAHTAANNVRKYINPVDKIMIIRIYAGQYRLYGKRNIGQVLYNDLKLTPVEEVKQIGKEMNQQIFTLDNILKSKADHLFIMTSPDKYSKQLLRQLVEDKKWPNIPAVAKHQVYHIDNMPWLEYSAYAHELLLERSVTLFKEHALRTNNSTNTSI